VVSRRKISKRVGGCGWGLVIRRGALRLESPEGGGEEESAGKNLEKNGEKASSCRLRAIAKGGSLPKTGVEEETMRVVLRPGKSHGKLNNTEEGKGRGVNSSSDAVISYINLGIAGEGEALILERGKPRLP